MRRHRCKDPLGESLLAHFHSIGHYNTGTGEDMNTLQRVARKRRLFSFSMNVRRVEGKGSGSGSNSPELGR